MSLGRDIIILKDISDIISFESNLSACSDGCEYYEEVRDRSSFLKVKMNNPKEEHYFNKIFNAGVMVFSENYLNKRFIRI